jgi:2-phosphosulfolactate phosphatase
MPSISGERTLSVVLSPAEPLPEADAWLVMDLLRATTTMVTFFSLGGERLYSVETLEEARELRKKLGEKALLLGERHGLPPEGFDLGNSPRDLTEEICRSHPLAIMTTTNGTKAVLKASSSGKPVFAASIRNASAAIRACTPFSRVGILCAGTYGKTALDDTLGAGYLADIFLRTFPGITLRDGAAIALWTWQRQAPEIERAVRLSDHARTLESLGFAEDLFFCCTPDSSREVPRWRHQQQHSYFERNLE